MDLFDRLKNVKAFVFRVDGVLTNGTLWVAEGGQRWRQISLRDGFALRNASRRGYPILALHEGNSEGLRDVLGELGIDTHLVDPISNRETLISWLEKKQLDPATIVYMGHDLPDMAYMRLFGLPSCPGDAAEEIKQVAAYISPKPAGMGAVRDIIEKTMKLQETWETDLY